jgi:hypothetical protein
MNATVGEWCVLSITSPLLYENTFPEHTHNHPSSAVPFDPALLSPLHTYSPASQLQTQLG